MKYNIETFYCLHFLLGFSKHLATLSVFFEFLLSNLTSNGSKTHLPTCFCEPKSSCHRILHLSPLESCLAFMANPMVHIPFFTTFGAVLDVFFSLTWPHIMMVKFSVACVAFVESCGHWQWYWSTVGFSIAWLIAWPTWAKMAVEISCSRNRTPQTCISCVLICYKMWIS